MVRTVPPLSRIRRLPEAAPVSAAFAAAANDGAALKAEANAPTMVLASNIRRDIMLGPGEGEHVQPPR